MPDWPDVADPQRSWTQLEACPSPTWLDREQTWLVHAPDQVEQVARDVKSFSNSVPGPRRMELDFLLTVDPPQHRLERAAFQRHFGVRIRAAAASSFATVAALAATVRSRDVVDLVPAFCRPLGAAVSDRIVGHLDPTIFNAAPSGIRSELHRLFDLRQQRAEQDASMPFHDLLQELRDAGVPAEVAGGRVAGLACAILIAAEDTLPAGAALALARIAAGDEVDPRTPLACDPPILGLYRVARQPATLGDVRIREGQRLFVSWAAANRASDTGAYTYGIGVHRCPAAGLVDRTVGAVAAHAQAHWRLELAEPVRFRVHAHLRAPTALRCRLESGAE
jgi:cytochrome P450